MGGGKESVPPGCLSPGASLRVVGVFYRRTIRMRVVLVAMLVGLTLCVGCQSEPAVEVSEPTPVEVRAAISKLGAKLQLDDNKAIVGIELYHPKDFDPRYSGRTKAITDAGLVHLKGLTYLQVLILSEPKVTDAGLAHLKGLKNLRFLGLAGTNNVTDAGLVHLKGMKNLGKLNLGFTNVAGAGLVHLKGLKNLTALDLTFTRVNDAGLTHLKELANLAGLTLMGTHVTNAGLAHLKGLSRLYFLYLQDTAVTDAGLVNLEGLTNLKSLHLGDTKVTDAGIKKLQQALPNCRINLDSISDEDRAIIAEQLKGRE